MTQIAALLPEQVVTLTAWAEARNQPVMGIVGVLSAIENRRVNGHWGSTYSEVCMAPWQFSCWNENDPNRTLLLNLADRMLQGQPLPYDPTFQVVRVLTAELVAGRLKDNVHTAMFYFNPDVVAPPSWAAAPAKCVARVGAHAYYVNVHL